jgi:hypothetical protein
LKTIWDSAWLWSVTAMGIQSSSNCVERSPEFLTLVSNADIAHIIPAITYSKLSQWNLGALFLHHAIPTSQQVFG